MLLSSGVSFQIVIASINGELALSPRGYSRLSPTMVDVGEERPGRNLLYISGIIAGKALSVKENS
jgi:hypothetical protein